ncbi:hypothetical protein TNCV_555501 [Trichonephila clavipes]|nr:hypothetical protein TNCV_555501 [Trichonephila clavipes]
MIQTLFPAGDGTFQDDNTPINAAGLLRSRFDEHKNVLTARVSEGKRFSEAVLQLNSASEKESVLLIEDQTDLQC